jgi:hypothetical protein
MPARKTIYILIIIISAIKPVTAQEGFRFSGQLSSWMNLNFSTDLPLWAGTRYIPQINYGMSTHSGHLFDTELSANISGTAGLKPFDSLETEGIFKPYRAWVRYSGKQFEVRLGLQKLSFGSALMLRPLMWFDQLDPRDPLQMTEGVWGLLGRYYFLNNANIWMWVLYGNKNRSGWEPVRVNSNIPELGGRVQLSVPSGEIAFTYNHRVADSRETGGSVPAYEKIPEDRFGLDAKWDLKAGLWIESSFTHKHRDLGLLSNQLIVTAGMDYTFAAGNGIYAAVEHLMFTYDEKPFAFSDPNHFSLMTLSYPIGLIDKISTIIYYGWHDSYIYSFLTWQRQYDKISLYLMAYWNPEVYQLPAQYSTQAIYAGKGIQIMFVFNH